ncbi:ATP phosphoribosyltransferase [Bacillus pseudomycoides]|nr:ATP phosphoribosyltransferase [Bacillus pseudomycoides]
MSVNEEFVTIALSKGRLLPETLQILRASGINIPFDLENSRELFFELSKQNLRFILVKSVDILLFLEKGIADLGVVGSDLLLEKGEDFVDILDFKIGQCKMCVCAKPGINIRNIKSVASKYPVITQKYFDHQHHDVEVIHLNGSVEIAPVLNMADCIVEIVQSGETLAKNGLIVYEKIEDISAKMVKRKTSLYKKEKQINDFMENFKKFFYNINLSSKL